jgi:uncharacterized protein YggE
MKYHRVFAVVIGMSIVSGWSAAVWSQIPPGLTAMAGAAGQGVVSGMGLAKVPLKPKVLRMHIELAAQGKTLPEALESLKDRREAALVQLEKLDAAVKSAKFTPPALAASQSDQKRRMEAMVRERMRGRSGKAAGKQAPKSYSVSTTLSVEWPLKAETPEQLLVVVETVREKVQAADLAGTKNAEKASSEEEEEAEEAAGMSRSYGGEEQVKPGEPMFVFVAPIPAEQQTKALAQAFAKAKAQAQQMAAAAGVTLGPLASLANSQNAGMNFGGAYGYRQQQQLQRLMELGMIGDEGESAATPDEAVAPDAHKLSFAVTVTASFAVQPK